MPGMVASFARNAGRRGARVILAGASKDVRRTLMRQGLRPPLARFRTDVEVAARTLRRTV